MMTRFLGAFGVAKARRERALFGELTVVLVIKMTLIVLAAVFVFGPSQRPRIDAAKVAAHLIGAAAPSAFLIKPTASRSK